MSASSPDPVRRDARPVAVTERELTAPVSLTRRNGRLNPDAVGWCRTPLVRTDGVGRGLYGKGRNKRWEYWAVTTPTQVVTMTTSDIDYAGVHGLWLWDRRTGAVRDQEVMAIGAGAPLPGTLGDGPASMRCLGVNIRIEEVDGGTRLRAFGDRIRVDVLAHRPQGHESLGVVVPWTERLFQYTVKDVARPATGRIWLDDELERLVEGESWATMDHGRGRWPRQTHWNWGAGSGRTDGRVIGIQLGGRWTDGTGSTENAVVVDGRLHKISEELRWDYDTEDWMQPWRVTGTDVDLTLTPEHDKVSGTDLRVVSSSTHQCFGTWSGRVRVDGEWLAVADVFGWAEDVHQLW